MFVVLAKQFCLTDVVFGPFERYEDAKNWAEFKSKHYTGEFLVRAGLNPKVDMSLVVSMIEELARD